MLSQYPNKHRHHLSKAATYSEDEADGGHSGGGHDFGTVGDQVEEDRHDGLCRVVEATAEHRRQVAGDRRAEQTGLFNYIINMCSTEQQQQAEEQEAEHVLIAVLEAQINFFQSMLRGECT